jgi:SAM-dependent methyltransferase
VFEVGSAFGMFLNMVQQTFPKARVSGSELTLTFRRVAYHEYGLQLLEDFDDSKQWDLIASYKVLEHQANPQKELHRYRLALKENGLLYISVPTWFHTMQNFGLDGFSLEYYYDKNHINVWTRKLFETLLAKCGLEIVKSNYVFYDSTYLCKRNDELMKQEPKLEVPTEIIAKLSAIKQAAACAEVSDPDGALKHFPAFPDAIIAHYEKNRAQYHAMGFDEIVKQVIDPALKACPDTFKIVILAADLHARYDKFEEALALFDRALKMKPGDGATLFAMAGVFRGLAARDPQRAAKFYTQSRDLMREVHRVSMQHAQESVTWIFADDAKIPAPWEVKNETEKDDKN